MAQILVRNLDERVVRRLKERAKSQGRSLQAQVKSIIEEAAASPQVDIKAARKLCTKLRRRFKGRRFPDAAKLIRKDRDR
jgi:plasmid stability protein